MLAKSTLIFPFLLFQVLKYMWRLFARIQRDIETNTPRQNDQEIICDKPHALKRNLEI